MRRSICYCDPHFALAGEVRTWRFTYTTSNNLPKGTRLKFDLLSKGRPIDWEVPTANIKKGSNVIFAHLENGKVIQGKEIEVPDSLAPQYEFVLPIEVESGENIHFVVGSPKEGEAAENKYGTRAQTTTQRRKSFHLYIDPKGKGRYAEPEVFTLDIRGNVLKEIRVLTPSFVQRNKRFDIIVRFEDAFGNLTSNAVEDSLIELSYENIRENLNWKLFIPETGFITLPNLYFNEPGVYTIRLLNTKTKEVFRSSPIRCFADNTSHLFWGLLHGESEKIDSTENIDSCLRHMRDEKSLNYFSSSHFENIEETPNELWKSVQQTLAEFDEADRFTTLTGFQWVGTPMEEGVRQFVYLKDGKQIFRRKDPKYSSLKKIYKLFSPKELLSIPSFSMGKGFEYDFNEYDPLFERVVEIYNSWGSSECTEKEGNPYPIEGSGKNTIKASSEGSVQKALQRNCRFGFVGGGLDDRGFYSPLFESDQTQYPAGLTGIIADEHTRSSLADALYNRSCYATTGERIIVGLSLAGTNMGSEINTAHKQGLLVNRHLSGYVAGTTKLEKIEIIRNGKVIHTINPDKYYLDFTYDDMTPLDKVTIDNKDKKPPFVYYYIRVTQEDGHMAWSSPIWVDLVPAAPIIKKIPTKVAAKEVKKPLELEDDFDDDEDDFEEEE